MGENLAVLNADASSACAEFLSRRRDKPSQVTTAKCKAQPGSLCSSLFQAIFGSTEFSWQGLLKTECDHLSFKGGLHQPNACHGRDERFARHAGPRHRQRHQSGAHPIVHGGLSLSLEVMNLFFSL